MSTRTSKKFSLFYKFILFFFHDNNRYLEKYDHHTNGNCKEIWSKARFSFDWFDKGRPDEIAIRVIPDRKELSRRLKGAGKSYSPLRDSVRELLQERSEEMARQLYWTLPRCWHTIAMKMARMESNLYLRMPIELLIASVTLTEFGRRILELGASPEEIQRILADYKHLLNGVVSNR